MVFNAIWFFLLKGKTQYQNQFSNHNYIIPPILFRKLLTLFVPILLHHARLVRSSSSLPTVCCPCPCWALTAYLSRLLGAGPPFTSFPRADPISFRSQATAHFYKMLDTPMMCTCEHMYFTYMRSAYPLLLCTSLLCKYLLHALDLFEK
jgi:hypothetical protein